MSFAAIPHTQAADFDNFVPLLFVAYVVYAIIAGLVKAARQAAQTIAQAAPPGQTTTADQVRAVLQRRLASAAAKMAPPQPAPVVVRLSATGLAAPPAMMSTQALIDASGMQPTTDVFATGPGPQDIASMLASLAPAAQAILASAVIGPCAAHRGGGHVPEDW